MKKTLPTLAPVLAGFFLTGAMADAASPEVREDEFRIGETLFRSTVVVPETDEPLPGIFMIPNWMGVSPQAVEKAVQIAEMGYVVYVADVYSADVRPENSREASAAAGEVRGDRELMRQRGRAALEHFRVWSDQLPVRKDAMAAIGFCFGGGMVLEMARDGAELEAFVSFHGDLESPTLAADSDQIVGKVLVLHGADDPMVPTEHVTRFMEAMSGTDADWQLVALGGAVHSFTNPYANSPGRSDYHPVAAKRAFSYMKMLFDETFGPQEPGE